MDLEVQLLFRRFLFDRLAVWCYLDAQRRNRLAYKETNVKNVLLVGLVVMLASCGCQSVTKEFCTLEAPKTVASAQELPPPNPPMIKLFTMTVDSETKEFYGPHWATWKDGRYQIGYRSVDIGKAAHLENLFVNFDLNGSVSVSYRMTTPMKYLLVPVWPGAWATVKFTTCKLPPSLPPPMPPSPHYFPSANVSVEVEDINQEGPGFFLGEKDAFNFVAGFGRGWMDTYLCSNLQLIGVSSSRSSDRESMNWGLDGVKDMSISANYRISCGDLSNVSATFSFVQMAK